MRPRRLVVVSGTGTEIGKTWVACATLRELRARGASVAARKPAQSFSTDDDLTDADILAAVTGEAVERVCPPHRSYPVSMAPPMAARALERPAPTLTDLAREVTRSWPDPGVDLGLVEGAGGLASPLGKDGSTLDLVMQLQPDMTVLVADAELGTINLVRLSSWALGDRPFVVHLNRFDPKNDLHRLNLEWLRQVDKLKVTTDIPPLVSELFSPRSF